MISTYRGYLTLIGGVGADPTSPHIDDLLIMMVMMEMTVIRTSGIGWRITIGMRAEN